MIRSPEKPFGKEIAASVQERKVPEQVPCYHVVKIAGHDEPPPAG